MNEKQNTATKKPTKKKNRVLIIMNFKVSVCCVCDLNVAGQCVHMMRNVYKELFGVWSICIFDMQAKRNNNKKKNPEHKNILCFSSEHL